LVKPTPQRSLELLSHFSLRSQYRLGDLLSLVLRYTSNRVSRQARHNIRLCFADMAPAEKQALYREAIRHTCYAMTELAAVWCWPVDRVLAKVASTDVCAEFEQSSQARIILAPHLGSWETLAVWLGKNCGSMFLYKRRKSKNRDLDQFIIEARARSGGEPVSTKKAGLRRLLIGLKKGGSVVILPDQKPSSNKARIDANFFGKRAPTTTLVNTLCRKVDCDVFIATASRSSPAGEFSLCIQPLGHARLAGDDGANARYMNDQIEQLVRQHLGQYQWGYSRFSNRVYESV